MEEFFTQFAPRYLPRLLDGALVTIQLSVLSMACGIAIGIVCAIILVRGGRILPILIRLYIDLCRGVPLIVILLFIYFTLPGLGIHFSAFAAGVAGLSFNLGAYLTEVFRAAITTVGKGQFEAGRALGMHELLIYRKVVLPQAARVALPTVGGYFLSLLKDCSLVSFISVEELLRQGSYIINSTFRTMEVYLLVAAIYYVMSWISAQGVRWIERRLTPAYLRQPT